MKIHYLKTSAQYWKDVQEGRKKFEIRVNDRDFVVGDTLILQEYRDKDVTGREIICTVEYILSYPPLTGENVVVLGISGVTF